MKKVCKNCKWWGRMKRNNASPIKRKERTKEKKKKNVYI